MLVGWGLGKPMDLNFEIFMIVLLVLAILVVGNFLRDGESNYLEGALLVVSSAARFQGLRAIPETNFTSFLLPNVDLRNEISGTDWLSHLGRY